MKKLNIRLTKIICVAGALVLVIGSMTACGKKKKISYGDTEGVVTGSLDINDSGVKFNLDNVIAPAGSDIDYTSGIKTSGETDDYSLEVNAVNVRMINQEHILLIILSNQVEVHIQTALR